MAAVASVEEQLAWEARQRPRAGAAAIAAGILTTLSLIWLRVGLADVPDAPFLNSLGRAFQSGAMGDQQSQLTPVFQYYVDKPLVFVGSAVLQAIAMIGLAWAVTFLAVAARARRPELPRYLIYVTLVGAVLVAVAALLNGVGRLVAINNFLDGSRTVNDARDVNSQPLLATAFLIGQLAPLALAAGILLVSLNAMRVGLLTRFLGVLGMISGGLTVFSGFFLFGPFVQAFWMLSLGFVFLNIRDGAPPAWRTGQAEPWPSQREVAAQRAAAKQKAAPPQPAAEAEAQPVPAGRPHPASKKRKRKRRG
ncbi:MAG TPA: hypothetical protein VFX51_16325 [Solirubrobacteraceae bacterium]|nr:hypothetical protein [Solirubrobacteraceae bacterium]